ncbi:hypothetical protein HOD29_02750 [archaeon]|jgi:hypothetical protein|nr:hypothetical protein [archaeon]
MKKFILLFSAIIFSVSLIGQEKCDSGYIYIKKEALPQKYLEEFQDNNVQFETVEKLVETVETLDGFNTTDLSFLVDTVSGTLAKHAVLIAENPYGKTFLGIVLYKIVGKDVLIFAVKLMSFIFWLSFIIWGYKKTFRTRFPHVRVKEGWRRWKTRSYKVFGSHGKFICESNKANDEAFASYGDASAWFKVLYGGFFIIGMLIIIFA